MKFLNINSLAGTCFSSKPAKNSSLLYANFTLSTEIPFSLTVIIPYTVLEPLFKPTDPGLKYTVDLSSNICNLWLCPNKIKSASLSLNNLEIACSSSFVIGAKGCSSMGADILSFSIS